jgi:hypothetical protein
MVNKVEESSIFPKKHLVSALLRDILYPEFYIYIKPNTLTAKDLHRISWKLESISDKNKDIYVECFSYSSAKNYLNSRIYYLGDNHGYDDEFGEFFSQQGIDLKKDTIGFNIEPLHNKEDYSGLELRPSVAQALDIFKEALKH